MKESAPSSLDAVESAAQFLREEFGYRIRQEEPELWSIRPSDGHAVTFWYPHEIVAFARQRGWGGTPQGESRP